MREREKMDESDERGEEAVEEEKDFETRGGNSPLGSTRRKDWNEGRGFTSARHFQLPRLHALSHHLVHLSPLLRDATVCAPWSGGEAYSAMPLRL
jgi:hypothetical protein